MRSADLIAYYDAAQHLPPAMHRARLAQLMRAAHPELPRYDHQLSLVPGACAMTPAPAPAARARLPKADRKAVRALTRHGWTAGRIAAQTGWPLPLVQNALR